MNNRDLTDKMELTELANKLFMFTDERRWQKLLDEVFLPEILFDMSSAGGGMAKNLAAREICQAWEKGFEELDAVHHQAGHYLIEVREDRADIFGYAVAVHFRRKAANGHTRAFVGSYDLKALRTAQGWRLSQFKYNLKFIDGNTDLK